MRKPPSRENVVALRGSYRSEIVGQDALRKLEDAQRVVWVAEKRAALLSERVKAALERGATIEDGPLYFDRELEMVRSRKQAAGGEK